MSALIDECLDGLSSTVQMNFSLPASLKSIPLTEAITDENLRLISDLIAIDSSALENQYKPIVREILTAIHEKSACPIDRYCVSGSLATQPNNFSDDFGFDITVFIDCSASHGQVEQTESDPSKKQLHMECAIQSFEKIYSSVRSFASPNQPIECDHRGVHFSHSSGLTIHLAVFPSLVHRMHVQRKSVWDLIENLDKSIQGYSGINQNELDRFSIGLHESITSFMHMGDPVFHGLVRLARLWRNQNLCTTTAELSTYAVVLIMMRCIEDEKARGMSIATTSSSHFPETRIFRDFLTCLSQIDTLCLTWQRFYEPDLLPERHMASRPLIADPVNPWRNLLSSITREQMETIKIKASESLKETRIDRIFPGLTLTATRGA